MGLLIRPGSAWLLPQEGSIRGKEKKEYRESWRVRIIGSSSATPVVKRRLSQCHYGNA